MEKQIIKYAIEEMLKFSDNLVPPKEFLEYCGSQIDPKKDVIVQIKSLLNKLTYTTFDKLSTELLDIKILNLDKLKAYVDLVFEKSATEPQFADMYALLCKKLFKVFVVVDNKPQTFGKHLLNKCQNEFNNIFTHETTETNKYSYLDLGMEDSDEHEIIKIRNNNIIKFICELYKISIIKVDILNYCLDKFISMNNEKSIELLCTFVISLNNKITKELSEKTKNYLENIKDNKEYPTRIRFKINDLIEKYF